MNRASSATGWVRNPVMKSPELDHTQASSYELGWTYNPLTGCLNHVNGMCKGGGFPCYAYGLANTRLRERYLANKKIATLLTGLDIMECSKALSDPFYPRFWPDRLKGREQGFGDYMSGAIPKGIFVCDMGDLFGLGVPEKWTRRVLENISQPWYKEHRFYLLTKQPQNLIKFSPFPDNCWVGVTATEPDKMRDAFKYLARIEAKVKYISMEPLLGMIFTIPPLWFEDSGVGWLIIGAQTKPYKPPKLEWVKEIVQAADIAGIPVFLKDNLKPLFAETVTINDKWVWAKDKGYGGLYKQEMPNEQE